MVVDSFGYVINIPMVFIVVFLVQLEINCPYLLEPTVADR